MLAMPPQARGDLGGQSHRIARDLIVLGRWDEALSYLDAALRAKPGNAAAAEERRRVLEMLRQPRAGGAK